MQQIRTQIQHYQTAQRQAGQLSPTTLKQYLWHLNRLAAWLDDHQIDLPSRHQLREWGTSLHDHWSPTTIKQAVCACRSLFAWLVDEQLLDENPALGLHVPKVRARLQRTITAAEVSALLDACADDAKGRRDRALINLLIDTGLRAAEVCRLRLSDLDLPSQSLTVKVKGGYQQRRFYGESTAQALRQWIDVRHAAPDVNTVFASLGGTRPGHPLTTRGLRVIVKRIGEKADIEAVSPHAFRRGFATIAISAGAPTRIVQIAGGWSDIKMVERYSQALQQNQLHNRWSPADLANGHRPDDP